MLNAMYLSHLMGGTFTFDAFDGLLCTLKIHNYVREIEPTPLTTKTSARAPRHYTIIGSYYWARQRFRYVL